MFYLKLTFFILGRTVGIIGDLFLFVPLSLLIVWIRSLTGDAGGIGTLLGTTGFTLTFPETVRWKD